MDPDDFQKGDKLRVDGERFEVSHIDGSTVLLTPRDENGGGQIEFGKLNGGRLIFRRSKGMDPSEIERRNA